MTETRVNYGPTLAVGQQVFYRPRSGWCNPMLRDWCSAPCIGHTVTVVAEPKDGKVLLRTENFEQIVARLDEVRAL